MEPRELKPGDVVQIIPGSYEGKTWMDGCFLVVTEPKPWGCQGYIDVVDFGKVVTERRGLAFLRPTWDKMEYIGEAVYVVDRGDQEE